MCAIHLADAVIGWGNGTQLPVHPGDEHCGLPGDHLPGDNLPGDHLQGDHLPGDHLQGSQHLEYISGLCPDTACIICCCI